MSTILASMEEAKQQGLCRQEPGLLLNALEAGIKFAYSFPLSLPIFGAFLFLHIEL